MNDDSILGATLGQLGQTVKQAAKQVVKLPEEMAKDVGGQVGSVPLRQGSEGQAKPGEPKQDWKSDEERVNFLRDLYGKSDMSKDGEEQIANKSASFAKASAAKPDEQKKLMELRQQLHKQNYYDPTFNPVKNPPAGGEERPIEKIEKEKKTEALELEKKEKNKPPPLAVVRERNKAEMFRGAAG